MCRLCDGTGTVMAWRKMVEKNSISYSQYAFNCYCGASERRGFKSPKWQFADKSIFFLEKPKEEPKKEEILESNTPPQEIDECPF